MKFSYFCLAALILKSPADAIKDAEVVVIATPFDNAISALKGYDLTGKIILDCTNPVGPGVTHCLNSVTSG